MASLALNSRLAKACRAKQSFLFPLDSSWQPSDKGLFQDLIGLAAMVYYEPLNHAREIVIIKLSSGCSCKARSARSSNIILLIFFFNKAIIPPMLVRYEMIIANLVLHTSLAIYHLISNMRSLIKCLSRDILIFFSKFMSSCNILVLNLRTSKGIFKSIFTSFQSLRFKHLVVRLPL